MFRSGKPDSAEIFNARFAMKKFFNLLSVFVLVAAVSCDKSGVDVQSGRPGGAKNSIGINKLSIGSLGTKAQGKEYENTLESEAFSLSVTTEVDNSLDSPVTKSAAVTTASLENFRVDGFLDKEIMDKGIPAEDKVIHFINGELVSKDASESTSTKWVGSFNNPQQWRYGIHHSFWAYTPDITLEVDPEDYTKSSFDYTSDFENDLILASTSDVYYGKEDEPASTRNNNLDLHFYHALSGISAEKNITWKSYDKNGTLKDDSERGEVVRITTRLLNEGSCDVEEGEGRVLSFNWTPEAAKFGMDGDFANGNATPRYVIPQSLSSALVSIVVKDKKRDLTRDDYTFSADELFGPLAAFENPDAPASERIWKSWEEGTWYRYKIKGSFNFPYVEGGSDVPGIDLGFKGHYFQSNYLVQSVNTKYTKRLKMTFTGLPQCSSAKGTFAFVSISPVPDNGNLAPVVIDPKTGSYQRDTQSDNFIGAGPKWLRNNNVDLLPETADRPEIGFIYDYFTLSIVSRSNGTPVGNVIYRDSAGNVVSGPNAPGVDFGNSICECYFDIDPSWDTITIWAGYIGSNSGKEKTNWRLVDSHIEIVEWR